ncbi:MAG: chemotaxis protein CheB [Saprospiraceae bacterium]
MLGSEKNKSEFELGHPAKVSHDFYVVGIGASAGGLEALQSFFEYCPDSTGMAFVIVQHLSPDYKSLMPELLSRHTSMPVTEALNEEEVLPNHIYMIPGRKNIIIENGVLKLIHRPRTSEVNFSIDIFLNSLAEFKKEKAIGVILSGTGSDGSRGGKSIKEIGGTVFVQDPDTCKFDGMPRSAISHGLADYILSSADMPEELVLFTNHSDFGEIITGTDLGKKKEYIYRILKLIKNQTQFDFYNYKIPTLLRRTAKRMNICKMPSVEEYIEYLYNHPEEKYILSNEFLIGVTKFFRDEPAFKEIEKVVIPALLKGVVPGQLIKTWSVACSTGEEAYSLAILLEEAKEKSKIDWKYRVFATDIDANAINSANKGIYNQNIMADVTPDRLKKYFIFKDGVYHISREIRKNIVFSKHDILQNPPFNKMDLVCCRNMLIYIESGAQHKILSSLHFALKLNGFLILGPSENISKIGSKFEVISKKWNIYTNISPTRIIDIQNNSEWLINKNSTVASMSRTVTNSREEKILLSVNRQIMEDFNSASICITEKLDITYAVGKLKDYIEIPDEGYSNNLARILPDNILIPITTGIRKIRTDKKKKYITKNVRILKDDKIIHLKIIIQPLDPSSKYHQFFTVTFINGDQRVLSDTEREIILPEIETNNEELGELKEALLESQQNLQATIEELETSNEEMQATNEELLAANEELQSTNEELQSLNEELHTVNAELQEKNYELLELNSDMDNLMKSTDIGTMFLDKKLNIRKYTPPVRNHFKLREEDLGRSITHFSGEIGLETAEFVEELKRVLETLVPIKKEFQTSKGEWYLRQILPYRSQQDGIQGVIVNFLDIDLLKKTEKEREVSNHLISQVNHLVPHHIWTFNLKTYNVEYYNKNSSSDVSFENYKKLLDEAAHPEDQPRIKKFFKKLDLLKDEETSSIEYRIIVDESGEYKWYNIILTPFARKTDGKVKTMLALARDINEEKLNQIKITKNEEHLENIYENAPVGIMLVKPDSTIMESSKGISNILGYDEKELIGKNLMEITHPDDFEISTMKLIKTPNIKSNQELISLDKRYMKKGGGYVWTSVVVKQIFNKNNKLDFNLAILSDITQRKKDEIELQRVNEELERFAYLASHDLKEPLRSIHSFANRFIEKYREKVDEKGKKYLDYIIQSTGQMQTLTDELLTYSKLGNKEVEFRNIDLNTTLESITSHLHKAIEESKASIVFHALPTIKGDSTQIEMLFQNLISNALKYRSKAPPVIIVEEILNQDYWEFSVKDNGIGILPEYHEKIFEVFRRLHNKNEYSGTGIGLSNCKRIVNNHEGKIRVESTGKNGSTFIFSIKKIKME